MPFNGRDPGRTLTRWFAVLAAAAAALGACRRPAENPGAVVEEVAWRKALLDRRAATDAQMRGKTSPLAAVARHILPADGATYFALHGEVVRAGRERTEDSAVVYRPAGAGNRWTWEPLRPGITAVAAGSKAPVTPGATLSGPTLIELGTGRFSLASQVVEETFVVMVYDAERPALREFKGLFHHPPDVRFVVRATLERWKDGQRVTIPTTIGLQKSFLRYGRLSFDIDGRRQQLTAYRPTGDGEWLFIPFRDATSGKTTYGAGRYLEVEVPPPERDEVLLDFNRAYSPLCTFSPAFNCPIPPRENHLQAAIAAGEKTYH